MDSWGKVLGESKDLTMSEKGEIVVCLFEGYKRQDLAFGYARAFRGLINSLPEGLDSLVQDIAFDVVSDIRRSHFFKLSEIPEEEFLDGYTKKLEDFECPLTGFKF
jgi:hypothetical protein